jgi:DNA-binding response OmpR family regulator
MRLLLVEDDKALGGALRLALQRVGYVVDWTDDGHAAVAGALSQEYAAVLLDLSLGGFDGGSALRALRAGLNDTPVIIVTAIDDRHRRLRELDAGADDYIVKPFDLDELLARLRVQVRRRDGRTSDVLQAGDVSLDLAARTACRDGQAVSLTAREFRVLTALMRRTGAFVSKSELESALYEDGAEVESNTIESAVCALRRKFGTPFIVTARGLGYMVPRRLS